MTAEVKDNLIALSDGQQASAELPLAQELAQSLNRATERRIFNTLSHGEPLSAEVAIQAWIERYTHHLLLRRLTQRVRMGQTAGEELAPDMKMKD